MSSCVKPWTCTWNEELAIPWDELWTTARFLSPSSFLYYRVAGALFWIVISFWDMYNYFQENKLDYWPIYLTHWALLLLDVYAVSSLAICIYWQKHKSTVTKGVIPKSVQWTWFLQNLALAVCPSITVMYWFLVFDGNLGVHTITKHGVNALYMMVDVCVTISPISMKHVWQPMAFGTIYLLFSLVYAYSGGTNKNGNSYIYSVLDWTASPMSAAIISAVCILIVVPFEYFLLYSMRSAAERYCGGPRTSSKKGGEGDPAELIADKIQDDEEKANMV